MMFASWKPDSSKFFCFLGGELSYFGQLVCFISFGQRRAGKYGHYI
jgi:hypothetical protein